jgi:hypothetical protein
MRLSTRTARRFWGKCQKQWEMQQRHCTDIVARDSDTMNPGDVVQAAVDAKGREGDSDVASNDDTGRCTRKVSTHTRDAGRNALTDVAPDGRKVDGGAVPHERVDELVEAQDGRPDHVVAGARVPRLQVPRERDEREDRPEEGDNREERPRKVGHVSLS